MINARNVFEKSYWKQKNKKNNHFSREPMQSSRKTFLATSPVGLVTDQAH